MYLVQSKLGNGVTISNHHISVVFEDDLDFNTGLQLYSMELSIMLNFLPYSRPVPPRGGAPHKRQVLAVLYPIQ